MPFFHLYGHELRGKREAPDVKSLFHATYDIQPERGICNDARG
jgi:hypothetical protein